MGLGCCSSVVEHSLGKGEVESSILSNSTIFSGLCCTGANAYNPAASALPRNKSRNPVTTSPRLRPRPVSMETVAVTPARKGSSPRMGFKAVAHGQALHHLHQIA